ncbi:ATP-binding protein [Culicoidibacter larvae]|uniref:ATP-binding protein n=1 Tax=Culicoidibacter larvae TaxID=2579976 RepID=A0A5R8QIR4_9FIRM|nr:ATP-binding protein [Culicoidibacter larvae]TLG77343.1 hypothetical protein FEZ08_01620 [Culicoidibacter larvae]
MEFPIKELRNNILVNSEGDVWCYYRIAPQDYEYLSGNEKLGFQRKLETLLYGSYQAYHLLRITNTKDLDTFKPPMNNKKLLPVAEFVWAKMKEFARSFYQDGVLEEGFYIGIQITPVESTISAIKDIIKGAGSLFTKAIPEIDQAVLSMEREVYSFLSKIYKPERLKQREIGYLTKRNYWKGIRPDFDVEREASTFWCSGQVSLESRYLRVAQDEKEVIHAYFVVSSMEFENNGMNFDYIYATQDLSVPVDLSIHIDTLTNEVAQKEALEKRRNLEGQAMHQAEAEAYVNPDLSKRINQMIDVEDEFKNSKEKPMLKASIVYGVVADTIEEIQIIEKELKERLRGYRIILTRPIADQADLMASFIPGAAPYIAPDYIRMMEPEAISSGVFGATDSIGSHMGFLLGVAGSQGRFVFFDPSQGPKADPDNPTATSSPSVSITGIPGSGKSVTANLIGIWSAIFFGKSIFTDPKFDRRAWAEELGLFLPPDLRELFMSEVYIRELGKGGDDAGILDPFITQNDMDRARMMALEVLSYLLRLGVDDFGYTMLSEACSFTKHIPAPTLNSIPDILNNWHSWQFKQREAIPSAEEIQIASNLARRISSCKDHAISNIFFANPDALPDPLRFDYSINVVAVNKLQLPDVNLDRSDYTIGHQLSTVVLMCLTAAVEAFITEYPSEFKFIGNDETWAISSTPQGRRMVDSLQLLGRSMNAAIYPISQKYEHIPNTEVIGAKFAGLARGEEATRIIEYFGLEPSEYLESQIASFEPGEMLFQDIYERIGTMQVLAIFIELEWALNTSPDRPDLETYIAKQMARMEA